MENMIISLAMYFSRSFLSNLSPITRKSCPFITFIYYNSNSPKKGIDVNQQLSYYFTVKKEHISLCSDLIH